MITHFNTCLNKRYFFMFHFRKKIAQNKIKYTEHSYKDQGENIWKKQSFKFISQLKYSFYNYKVHIEIDELQERISSTTNFMDYLIKALEIHIDDKIYFKKQ